MARITTGWRSTDAALNHSVKGIASDTPIWIDTTGTGDKCCWIEIKGLMFDVVGRTEQADSQAKIQSQTRCDVPIVLKVRFKYLVTKVVLRLVAALGKAGDIAHEQVGKGIARADRGACVIDEEPVH